jgi:hypothetical protein
MRAMKSPAAKTAYAGSRRNASFMHNYRVYAYSHWVQLPSPAMAWIEDATSHTVIPTISMLPSEAKKQREARRGRRFSDRSQTVPSDRALSATGFLLAFCAFGGAICAWKYSMLGVNSTT